MVEFYGYSLKEKQLDSFMLYISFFYLHVSVFTNKSTKLNHHLVNNHNKSKEENFECDIEASQE